MKRLRILVAALLAIPLGWLAFPASAQTTDTVACPSGVPDAGFTDVNPQSIHYRDINCIAFYGITVQVGTFDPTAPVTREQMALFITRTYETFSQLPGATTREFTDIGHLELESQFAIEDLAGLSVTSGTTATTYEPAGLVTREQMALFLVRTLRAAAVDVPGDAPQVFTDISGLTPESQLAINQARQVGITTGATATTYEPTGLVTREQMASFLARTLDAMWDLSLLDFSLLDCTGDATLTCTGTFGFPANRSFRVIEGFVSCLCDPLDLTTTNFTLSLDGALVPVVEKNVVLDGMTLRLWEAKYPAGMSGTHVFTGQWSESGATTLIVTLTVDFT